LVTSADAPKVEGVYKLVAVERGGEMQPSMKLSKGKATLPGEKTVHRVSEDGRFDHDVIGERHEALPGEELLEPVFESGELIYDPPSLDMIKDRTLTTLRHLPPSVRVIENPDGYDVRVSDALQAAVDRLESSLEEQMLP
jgi:nicotinate phosphoribosyltransferase